MGKLTSTNFNVGVALPERRNAVQATRLNEIFYSRKPPFLELNDFLPHETYPVYIVVFLAAAPITVRAKLDYKINDVVRTRKKVYYPFSVFLLLCSRDLWCTQVWMMPLPV